MTFTIPAPLNFNLWSTVMSHGWYALPPFRITKELQALHMTVRLTPGEIHSVVIDQPARGKLRIASSVKIGQAARNEMTGVIGSTLRLSEDFGAFYREAKRLPQYRWVGKAGAGRMLRSPTVFEDTLKMMCTTNCSWALTEIMVKNLCVKFGAEAKDGWHAFPAPEAIAGSSEKFLRKEIRAGYRSPYILEFARRTARKEIDPESWRRSTLPTQMLFEEVRTVKGIGPYAAGNILKLLGRYDYLGIDSWCRKKFFELHTHGRKRADKAIEKHYQPLGEWRGLFFWLELTKHWYDKEKSNTLD